MSGITNLHKTRAVLLELARVVEATRQTLSGLMHRQKAAPSHQPGHFASTLSHVEAVREGFILSQRAAPQLSAEELRRLVKHVLMDWGWMQELGWMMQPASGVEQVGPQLVAYNHAQVALAVLPRLPAEAVTFPQRRPTYRDVNVPVEPGELLERIEEIEQMIYRVEVDSLRNLDYNSFRRTYAYFEASSWLVKNYLKPLL
ncbi:MAG: hypothetical protein Kow0031_27860 [Anaerolineae bacterium]